jgi:hypothetical protein
MGRWQRSGESRTLQKEFAIKRVEMERVVMGGRRYQGLGDGAGTQLGAAKSES